MISRFYSLLFILIVVGGMIFQRHYMRSSKREVSEIAARLREDTVLVKAQDFTVNRYNLGKRTDLLKANFGDVLTSGNLTLEGDIQIFRFENELPMSRLRSERATGFMRLPSSQPKSKGKDLVLIDEQQHSENLRFPDKVRVFLREGQIETSDVHLTFDDQLLKTLSPVAYRGLGKSLHGHGMSYRLQTGEFELGGPVTGRFDPASGKSPFFLR